MDCVYVKSEILNSWKEIATYLDRGVRTVQRLERELHLPVRRPRGKKRSAVLALRKDIDAWLANCPQLAFDVENGDVRGQVGSFQEGTTTSLSHSRVGDHQGCVGGEVSTRRLRLSYGRYSSGIAIEFWDQHLRGVTSGAAGAPSLHGVDF